MNQKNPSPLNKILHLLERFHISNQNTLKITYKCSVKGNGDPQTGCLLGNTGGSIDRFGISIDDSGWNGVKSDE